MCHAEHIKGGGGLVCVCVLCGVVWCVCVVVWCVCVGCGVVRRLGLACTSTSTPKHKPAGSTFYPLGRRFEGTNV